MLFIMMLDRSLLYVDSYCVVGNCASLNCRKLVHFQILMPHSAVEALHVLTVLRLARLDMHWINVRVQSLTPASCAKAYSGADVIFLGKPSPLIVFLMTTFRSTSHPDPKCVLRFDDTVAPARRYRFF